MKRFLFGTGSWILLAATACAQEEGAKPGPVVQFLSSILPVFLIFGCLFFVFRRVLAKQRPYQQRAIEHMDRIEQKYDRIIQLLEKLTAEKQ